MKFFWLTLVIIQITSTTQAQGETTVNGRRSLVLDGQAAQLVVDLAGGSIADFHFKGHDLNPLQWEEKGAPTAARPMGHFLCLDRWGAPSEAERKNGMPFHGEAARVEWQVAQEPVALDGRVRAEAIAILPLAGLRVRRQMELQTSNAFLVVKEEVTNLNKLGRIFNLVQHATIGPPFLDERTIVDSNARQGFMQSSPLPNPEVPAVRWPQALKDGQPVDMRRLSNDPNPNVVSYTIEDEYGWATACNPERGLLIGYLWRSAEYPWFNAWRHVENAKPRARGLEFGTTGLHQPFPVLVAKGKIFGHPLYEYLDASQTVAKSYACFLFKIPRDYKGVDRVTFDGRRLILHEHDAGTERDLSMEASRL